MSKNLEKNWQIFPKISEDFIKKYPDLSRVVLQLLFNRGITGKDEIEEFLNPPIPLYPSLSCAQRGRQGGDSDPFLFKDMEKAVDLIIGHIKKQNKIVIYGDYDADGVTSSALLSDTLTALKAKIDVYLPDRVSEGYGLNKGAINELTKDGVKLIITVDGGIRNKEEVEYAKKKGLEVVITDHHIPPEEKNGLPDCLIINSLVEGEKYPFKNLAGVGVAFKLAKAIISKAKIPEEEKIKLEERVLDLAAIGTVADCVSLLGENRVLVKRGLEVLNKTKRAGLLELIKAARINNNKKLDSWNIGFQIAPRLNAAGRMDHANTALELLITKDKKEAEAIAMRLNDRNIERQRTTEDIVEQIVNQVEKSPSPRFAGEAGQPPLLKGAKIIIAVTPDGEIWNEGVVGLVAGRISDRYYLPTLVITKGDDGYKGSGRSIFEFNIMEAIEECAELLEKFGGHPMACGFSLSKKDLEKFKKKIIKIADEKLKSVDLKPKIKVEAEIGLNKVDEKFIAEIEKFAPFGQNNDKPKFVSRGVKIVDIITMGIDGKHVKFRITNDELRMTNTIFAIGFGQAEKWKELRIGDTIDIVYYAEMNEFNGRSEVQLKIVDIKINYKSTN